MLDIIFLILEIIGTVAFAVSGAIVGLKKKMDIFGVAVLGLTTAVGGGVIRDIILGITPPNTFKNPIYALIAVSFSLLICLPFFKKIFRKNHLLYDQIIFVMDSVGLGIFTVIGIQTAYEKSSSENVFLMIFVGVVTGVGGGIMRDVFAGSRPRVFVKDFYASASLIGTLITSFTWNIAGNFFSMVLGAAVVIILRFFAAYYHWHLPKPDWFEEDKK